MVSSFPSTSDTSGYPQTHRWTPFFFHRQAVGRAAAPGLAISQRMAGAGVGHLAMTS